MKDKIAYLKNLIAKDKLELVLEELSQLSKNSDMLNEIIHQSGRYNYIKSKIRQGVIDTNIEDRERNNLRKALIELIDQIDEEQVLKPESSIESHQKSDNTGFKLKINKKYIYVATLCLLALAGWFGIQRANSNEVESLTIKFDSFRNFLKYYVDISAIRYPNSNLLDTLNTNKYLFYESNLDYERIPPRKNQNLIIAAITDPEKYRDWIHSEDVVYREIIGIEPEHKEWLDKVVKEIVNAQSVTQKLNALSKLIEIQFWVNGKEMVMSKFEVVPFGFSLEYQNPYYNMDIKKLQYRFSCKTFQPKKLNYFAVLVPEATSNLDIKLTFYNAKLIEPEYFSAFTFSQNIDKPKVTFDKSIGVLKVESPTEEIVLPGNGLLLLWK